MPVWEDVAWLTFVISRVAQNLCELDGSDHFHSGCGVYRGNLQISANYPNKCVKVHSLNLPK
jgi:hypothetical protein